jgi:hypothetical protein
LNFKTILSRRFPPPYACLPQATALRNAALDLDTANFMMVGTGN